MIRREPARAPVAPHASWSNPEKRVTGPFHRAGPLPSPDTGTVAADDCQPARLDVALTSDSPVRGWLPRRSSAQGCRRLAWFALDPEQPPGAYAGELPRPTLRALPVLPRTNDRRPAQLDLCWARKLAADARHQAASYSVFCNYFATTVATYLCRVRASSAIVNCPARSQTHGAVTSSLCRGCPAVWSADVDWHVAVAAGARGEAVRAARTEVAFLGRESPSTFGVKPRRARVDGPGHATDFQLGKREQADSNPPSDNDLSTDEEVA